LGLSGLRVTRLGFGCEEAKDPKLIRAAADLGINHFNSFPNRGDISNFPVVGEALRPIRSRVVLATGSNNRTRSGLLEDLDRQLRALGTDYPAPLLAGPDCRRPISCGR
jgi:aryl-alcohol dehydrogenase-like predicted oxidoreductase